MVNSSEEWIYNLAAKKDYEAALQNGFYSTESLRTEGFIHSSKKNQVEDTANRIFSGRTDLVLLYVKTDRLKSPLKYEASDSPKFSKEDGKNIFPHIYGPLNTDAIEKAVAILPDADGKFRFPFLD
ncbi:DUF952 domain-containing protein [Leptospira yasudae]|uniref:DUF952 domain-containing protein n=2 Tax=Leptospira yasudae TaxID=2202201 RepID=A0ABX9M7L2_9LEPT|nr:DUF952 domain-containing protein [Leptospira yasudae]MBW0432699.1 DUF952 domain-containing protein [Leptospira yasudae]RHX81436.1 DUF952 domain-containing protein [Leptospira yasudae]RHX96025.1 DUF952 domain-containing protein [Leptospira yasudae]TGK30743.1 DUF952 domain-containing protein [Leptospira yasudae]TGM07539.1 DUF952 domain-containing protein [Leptospira yasudae]